jgi:hypothetical protein
LKLYRARSPDEVEVVVTQAGKNQTFKRRRKTHIVNFFLAAFFTCKARRGAPVVILLIHQRNLKNK